MLGPLLLAGLALMIPAVAGAAEVDTVGVRVGEHLGFSRVVFDWPRRVDYDVRREVGRAFVTFSAPGPVDLSAVRERPLRYVHGAEAHGDDEGTTVILDLPKGVRLRDFRQGTKIVLDVVARPGHAGGRRPGAAAGAEKKNDEDDDLRLEFDIDSPPKMKNELTPYLSWGGSVEVEFEREENFDLDDSTGDNLTTLEPELELGLTFKPNDFFEAFLDVVLIRQFEIEDQQNDRHRPTRLRIKQLNATLHDIFEGFSMKIGRQRIEDEREWFYDDELDAVRLFYRFRRLGIEASVSRKNLVDEDLLNDDRNERINNYFLVGRYRVHKDLEAAAFVLWRDDRSKRRGSPIFLGVQVVGEAFDSLKYWLDFAHVRGEADFDRPRARNDAVRAYGFDVGASYAFDLPLKPSLSLAFAFGTGDGDTSDGVDHGFRQTRLQDNDDRFSGVTGFKYYGELFDPELNNIKVFTGGVGIRPLRKTSVDLVFHHYRQHKTVADLRNAGVDMDPAGLNRTLGNELDLIVGFPEIKNFTAELVLGLFMPGRAFAIRDDAYLASLKFRYRF